MTCANSKFLYTTLGKEYALAYKKGTAESQVYANFYEARYVCNYTFGNSYLIEPMNEREQSAITSFVSGGSVWLGFNSIRRFMHWVKESDGGEMTYAHFRQKAPWTTRRETHHCVLMSLVKFWLSLDVKRVKGEISEEISLISLFLILDICS